MARLIWWLAVGALAWWVLRRWLHNNTQSKQPPTPSAPVEPSQMVACAHCGLHLPESEAIRTSTHTGPLFYCCAEHARTSGLHPDR